MKGKVYFNKRGCKLECGVLLKNNKVSKEMWLQARQGGITGNDIAAILGMNRYKSSMAVYLEKVMGITEEDNSESMYLGESMQDFIVKEFSKRNKDYSITRVNGIMQNKDCPIAIGNIKRVVKNKQGQVGVLQVNIVSEYSRDKWMDKNIPMDVQLKLQWYMFITGTDYAVMAVIIGGNKYEDRMVYRNEDLIKIMKNVAITFWEQNVLKKEMPVIDGEESTTFGINKLYSNGGTGEVDLKDEALDIIAKRNRLRVELRELEGTLAQCDNKLKVLLGDNEVGIVGERKVIWKATEKRTLNTKALKEQEPEIYEKYVRVSSYRRFEVR